MSAAIKLSPEVYGQIAELGAKFLIGVVAKRMARPVADMTEADLLADAQAFVAGFEDTDTVIAEERERLGAKVGERNPEAAGTPDSAS